MKNLNLNAYGVSEMNSAEMRTVEGGNIFKDAWAWIEGAAEDVANWIEGHVKPAPGGGIVVYF